MRKALELPRIDETKVDAVSALIAAISEKGPGNCGEELAALSALTGKLHDEMEFLEYWSWTDLDALARMTLAPEPPLVRDLTQEDLVELAAVIQHCLVAGPEYVAHYYLEMLRKSLALPGIRDYIVSAQTPEEAAADLLAAAGRLAE